MLFDVEAQKQFYPGYQLVTRGIFYIARMISAQLGTEFTGSDYDDIKKVYSIWICMDAPHKLANSTTEYRMKEYNIKGGVNRNRQSYDKMSVIMVCLNEDIPAQQGEIHHLLNTLFSTKLTLKEKKKILVDTYNLEMGTDLEKEVTDMCNWSDAIEERGIRRGIEQGIERGEEYFALLTGCLLRDSKTELLQKVVTDKNLRNELYKEYGIAQTL